jgi:PEP-CTERM motif
MGQGFMRAGWFRVLAISALTLIMVPELPASILGDSSSIAALSLTGLAVEMTGHAKQGKTVGDSPKGEFGGATLITPCLRTEGENVSRASREGYESKVSAVAVFADVGATDDYEEIPLTLLSEVLILSDFADGKRPRTMSLARVKDGFRGGDLCSDLGKDATCTIRGGFFSFYENTSPIPEPGTFLLVGSGVLGSSLPVVRAWRARLSGIRDARISS